MGEGPAKRANKSQRGQEAKASKVLNPKRPVRKKHSILIDS